MKKTNKKGFTLIELLTVIAILAVILLIAAPIILGVLDKARKNTFKNQVLLYVEGLKTQTALAAMGSGYSDLAKNTSNAFYAPTSDTTGTASVVEVSVTNLNTIMDNAILEGANTTANPAVAESYFYVQYTPNGYNYYIGTDVHTAGGYKTVCPSTLTGNEACVSKTAGTATAANVIDAKSFSTNHIARNDR